MTKTRKYDVVVVGASIGGCTAAILYARHGLNVALVERSKDVAHYKKVCTHYLQPLALGTLRKLGLDALIEAAGGRRNDLEAWTEWGWIRGGDPARVGHGYNIRRQTLDPILRNLALGTPGVSFHEGAAVCDLTRDARGRISGVLAEDPAGRVEFRAPLVVAADGRTSRVAKLAAVDAHVDDNGRFTYYTYYRGVALSSGGNAQYWHLHPNLAYAFRNDDDTTLLGIFLPRGELRAFKADPLGHFRRFWEGVPDAPLIGNAAPICELRGATEIPNHWRPASAPGIAFVGDAAMALDPIWGTGCSYAFASADWLVEHTAPAFGAGKDLLGSLDRGLARYRKVHRSRTRWHYAHIASLSTVRDLNWAERLVFSAATRDAALATRVLTYLGRTVGPLHLATPPALCRTALVNLGGLFSGRTKREALSLALEAGELSRGQPGHVV
jgi:flavin-dependent dehydrogenase